jgi:hypothetical protein
MSFCCHDGQTNPSTPAQWPSGRERVNAPSQAISPIPGCAVPTTADDVAFTVLRRYPPAHGYRSADLSILLSLFLI